MKRFAIFLVVVAFIISAGAPFVTPARADSGLPVEYYAPITIGDNEEKVISLLGDPYGWTESGKSRILYYGERGTVTLTDGKVSIIELVSTFEASQKKAKREQAAAARRETARAAAEQRNMNAKRGHARGLSEKATKTRDPNFAALPASERLTYWKSFQKLYPGVSVVTEIIDAEAEVTASAAAIAPTIDPRRAKLLKEIEVQKEAVKKADALAHSSGKLIRRRGRRALKKEQATLTELEEKLKALESELKFGTTSVTK